MRNGTRVTRSGPQPVHAADPVPATRAPDTGPANLPHAQPICRSAAPDAKRTPLPTSGNPPILSHTSTATRALSTTKQNTTRCRRTPEVTMPVSPPDPPDRQPVEKSNFPVRLHPRRIRGSIKRCTIRRDKKATTRVNDSVHGPANPVDTLKCATIALNLTRVAQMPNRCQDH